MSLLIPTRTIKDTTVAYPKGYHRGELAAPGGLPDIEPDLVASKIMWGETMFGILGTMLSWIYNLIMTGLVVPTPSVSLAVAEDHSGGAHTATPSEIIPAPVVGLSTELSWLLVEDCEDAWNEYVQANVVSSADGVTKKIGAASAKMAVAAAAAVGRLATEAIGPLDLSPYKYLKAWIRSSVAISSNDISILLDDTASCISPLKDLNIGALVANTWTEVLIDMGDTSGLTAIISIGVDMDVDKGVFDFWVDQVRVTKGGV